MTPKWCQNDTAVAASSPAWAFTVLNVLVNFTLFWERWRKDMEIYFCEVSVENAAAKNVAFYLKIKCSLAGVLLVVFWLLFVNSTNFRITDCISHQGKLLSVPKREARTVFYFYSASQVFPFRALAMQVEELRLIYSVSQKSQLSFTLLFLILRTSNSR